MPIGATEIWGQISLLPDVETFTGDGNGTLASAHMPLKYFALQVVGTGAAATAWNVVLEGGLDSSNFTTLLNHVTADGDGKTIFSSSETPVNNFRVRVASLTLGSATNINVYVAATS